MGKVLAPHAPITRDGVATYPLAGGRREGARVRLPWEENARSRHQRLFEENIRKNGKVCVVYELWVWKVQELYLRTGKVLAPHKGWQPLIKCAISCIQFVLFSLFYVFMSFYAFCIFLSFCGREGCFPHSYISSIVMRKSDLRSSLRTKRWLSRFYLFSQDIF